MTDTVSASSGNAGGSLEPTTASKLLRLLEVDKEPVTRQRLAIGAWLTDNTPTAALQCSLRANGYGFLLKRRPVPWHICQDP